MVSVVKIRALAIGLLAAALLWAGEARADCTGQAGTGAICNNPDVSTKPPIYTANPVIGTASSVVQVLGRTLTSASTTVRAGFNIAPGVAPTSPTNGDLWSTGAGFFGRAGGVTYGPFTGPGAASFAATSPITVSFPASVVTYACATCVTSSGGGAITGTPPIAVSAAGVVSITGAAGQVLAGAAPAFTATPTLGASGTLGSLTFGNATSGLLTLQPVTGALGTVTISLPAATDTLMGKATTDTMTGKTYDTAGAGNSFLINGLAATANTGTGGTVVRSAGPTISALVVTGSFTATGLVTNAALANPSTTVNGQTCTLGSTCTVTAAATSITVGSTTISGGTTTNILRNNAGVLAEYTISGSGTVVAMATAPTFTTPILGVATGTSLALGGCTISTNAICATGTANISGAITLGGAITYGGVTLSNAVTGTGNMVLSASPTLTGTVAGAAANWSGAVTAASYSSTGAHTAYSGTAIPAGGTAGSGYLISSTANYGVFFGSGVPTLSAAQGSIYLRSDGAPYYNNNGSTGWTSLAAGAGTVTSVAAGTGMSFSTITTTGSVAVDIATSANFYGATASKMVDAAIPYTAVPTPAFSATPTFDFGTAASFAPGTMTANITSMTCNNLKANQGGFIKFVQDGTGSRTTVFCSAFKFVNGSAPALSTPASSVDYLIYTCETSSRCPASLIKNTGWLFLPGSFAPRGWPANDNAPLRMVG